MTTHPPSPRQDRYLKFAGLCVAVTAVLAAIGWIPTTRWAGPEGVPALLVGCGVSLAAALIGGLVIVRGQRAVEREAARRGVAPAGPQALFAALKAMGIRLLLVAGLGVTAALSGAVAVKPFLLWMALSYLALLPGETRFALAAVAETAPVPVAPEDRRKIEARTSEDGPGDERERSKS